MSHVKYECGKEPAFSCPHCSYRTKVKGNLKSHIYCRHRELIIKSKMDLLTNFLAGAPFKCPTCPKSYKYKHNLNSHLRLECGKEPGFQCPHCPYKSKQKAPLKSHIGRKHMMDSSKIQY
ncbi:longitudinals lacking protein, isoforms A/B/D/L-like [Cimex lectularius]|uniref:C2H2-type domain-containing protein n=1 Tax=Cimex lectularius TaxID=79782 RepID=A0A8I6SRU4_CIMLE|nr:longitudinals lacking protein, isoforms A/B/D/L-like [Cimex lectularius]